MSTELDITHCRECGDNIVITLADLDYPICKRVDCFRNAFPDDYEELMGEIEKNKLLFR